MMGTLLKSRWQEILLDFFSFVISTRTEQLMCNTVLIVLISREREKKVRERGGDITESQNEMTEQNVKCPLQLYIYKCVRTLHALQDDNKYLNKYLLLFIFQIMPSFFVFSPT